MSGPGVEKSSGSVVVAASERTRFVGDTDGSVTKSTRKTGRRGAHRVHIDGRLIVGDGSLRDQKTQYKASQGKPEKLAKPHPFDLGSLSTINDSY